VCLSWSCLTGPAGKRRRKRRREERHPQVGPVREGRGREGTPSEMWDKQANEETTKLVEQQIPTGV